jgi:Putative Ig domain.
VPPTENLDPVLDENSPLPSGFKGTPYRKNISVRNGKAPMTWSATSIPDGLTLTTDTDSRTGVLAGTPNAKAPPITHIMATKVTDANSKSSSKNLEITINKEPDVTTQPPPKPVTVPDPCVSRNLFEENIDDSGK